VATADGGGELSRVIVPITDLHSYCCTAAPVAGSAGRSSPFARPRWHVLAPDFRDTESLVVDKLAIGSRSTCATPARRAANRHDERVWAIGALGSIARVVPGTSGPISISTSLQAMSSTRLAKGSVSGTRCARPADAAERNRCRSAVTRGVLNSLSPAGYDQRARRRRLEDRQRKAGLRSDRGGRPRGFAAGSVAGSSSPSRAYPLAAPTFSGKRSGC
jgi:hypothetical protein